MSRKDNVGIAPQADMDTEASAVAYSPPLTGESLALNRAEMNIDEMLGNRGPSKQEYGLRSLSGPLNGALRPRSGGLILASYWGAPVSAQPDAAGAPAVYQHLYDPYARDYPVPLSIWGVNNDALRALDGSILPPIVTKYLGAVGNTLTLSCEVNNYLLAEAAYLAKDVKLDEPNPSMSRDASGKWPFNQLFADMSVAGGPLVEIPIGQFSFAYGNNPADDQGKLGSVMLDDVPLGNMDSTLTFTALRDVPSFYKRAFADSPEQVTIRIRAIGPTIATVGAVTYAHSLVLDFPYLQEVTAPVARSGSDTLRNVEVTANIVNDDTTGKLFTATLTNTEDGSLYREPQAA